MISAELADCARKFATDRKMAEYPAADRKLAESPAADRKIAESPIDEDDTMCSGGVYNSVSLGRFFDYFFFFLPSP